MSSKDRKTMGGKMKNAPVYYTVAQVQHNPLLSLDSYLPSIQESMRRAGYPDFRRGLHLAVSLSAESMRKQEQESPPLQKVEQFSFADITNTKGYILLPNAISFHTSNYDTFDSFAAEFITGLNIVSSAVDGLSFVERLGLRYLDAVAAQTDEKLDQYLVREVLGLPFRMA